MTRKRAVSKPPPASSSEEEKGLDNEKTLKNVSGNGGSDSESDSDNSLLSPNVSDFTIKPIVTQPKKSSSKSTTKPKPTATKSSSKQRKPSSSASNGDVKSAGTSRLLSEADEKSNKRQKKIETLSNSGDVSTEVSSDSEDDEVDFWKDYPCLRMSFDTGVWGHLGDFVADVLENNAGMFESEKLLKMESEWRKFKIEELKVFLMKSDLVKEIGQEVLDFLKIALV